MDDAALALLRLEGPHAAIAAWRGRDDELAWIARALRRDLAVMVAAPQLALPCLHRRCAWLGAPAEVTFYADREPLPPVARAAAHLVHRWEAAIATPWLRSLRPSPLPLDAAVREEYRTDRSGALAWSADGGALGVANAIAWDRTTARTIAPAALEPPAAPPPWRLIPAWGEIVLSDGVRRISISVDRDTRATDVFALGAPDCVLVRMHDLDNAASCALIAITDVAAMIAWRTKHDALAVAPATDDRVFIAAPGFIAVYALATGDLLGNWTVPRGEGLALSPDGRLAAIRDGGVIRVWDIAAALASPQPFLRHQPGFVEAQLSPDESRVVTGSLLADAHRGTPVAALNVDRGTYLEGGPPPRARRLCDGLFVEITPFGLTAWSTRTGTPLLFDRERRATLRDVVRFDATGRYCALVADGHLTLHRIEGGEPLFERYIDLPQMTVPNRLGFARDGEQLWWRDATNEIWMVPTSAPKSAIGPVRVDEPPDDPVPPTIVVRDGILGAAGAAIPCDDPYVIASRDGRILAGRTSHYRLVTDT